MNVNHTHDPALKSWVETANVPGVDFPIQNLPFGVFRSAPEKLNPRIGVAIGDRILDLWVSGEIGLLQEDACSSSDLNHLMALTPDRWSELRARISGLLSSQSLAREQMASTPGLFTPLAEAEMLLPATIGDYTDFYASVFHATNVGNLFRPGNPLLPNYKWVPIGYHGRASSVVVSGTPVRRPNGQTSPAEGQPPVFGPTKALDYELEVGFFTGPGNRLGEPIPIAQAESHIFGLCLVNDWSARDIQRWEYQPLGPFLAKSFATSISPWVVTLEALAPFRTPPFVRPAGDPQPLPYLATTDGGIDLTLEVWLQRAGQAPAQISLGNLRDLYWTLAQLLTHHTSNGCNLRPGDLIASGTVSGPTPGSQGCLLEIPSRTGFLEDGDEVIIKGYCQREGHARIGFGECRGVITPAVY